MLELRIRLFGHPQIAGNRPTAKPLRRRAMLLLAYLVLRRGALVPRVKVASDLYPDSDPTAAHAQLRRTVLDLERWLNTHACFGALTCSRTHLCVGDSIGSVDVWDWQAAHDASDYEYALELYAGELLLGFDDAWIAPIRDRYACGHHADLHSAMERSIASHPANALRVAEACMQDDPYDERAVRAIMETQARQGDSLSALRSYDAFAARLRAELQTVPEPGTIALRDAIAENQRLNFPTPTHPALRNVSEALASHRCVTLVTESDGQQRALDDILNGLASRFDSVWSIAVPPPAEHLAQRIGSRHVCIVLHCRPEDDDETGIAIERILQTCTNACVVSVSEHPLNVNGEFVVDADLRASE